MYLRATSFIGTGHPVPGNIGVPLEYIRKRKNPAFLKVHSLRNDQQRLGQKYGHLDSHKGVTHIVLLLSLSSHTATWRAICTSRDKMILFSLGIHKK